MAELEFDPTTVPTGPSFDALPDIPAIARLKSRPQWVSWKYEHRPGADKPTKPLFDPKTGFKASHSNPNNWGAYNEAVTRVIRSGLEGVGYVLSEDDDLTGADLDNCRDAETGEIEPWAAAIVALAESYIEISPSGQGLRIFWEGKVPEAVKCDPVGVEIYGSKRYLTVTGQQVIGTPDKIRPAPNTEAALRARVDHYHAIQSPVPAPAEPKEESFFRKVNTAAFADLSAWVPSLFPMAKFQNGTGGYRIPAQALGDKYQEDLSIHPRGAVYFGVHDMGDAKSGKRSAIDLAQEWGGHDAKDAALWLCHRLGRPPAFFGWKDTKLANQLLAKNVAEPDFDFTPWSYVDPKTIPPRQWLYGKHYIRKFVTATISPGGIGKTSLVLAEAIAMVTGRPILGITPEEICRVMVWNGEDPIEEIQRRVLATCQGYNIDQKELTGLFLNSGRNLEIVIAQELKGGAVICAPIYDAVVNAIFRHKIDVLIIDPFVSSHRVNENDNNSIDLVSKAWARIADVTNCSIELVHHARKTGGQDVTVEHARGASALISAARSARTLNGMSEEEEAKAGKSHVQDRRQFFRVDNGKANMALPPNRSTWFKLVSVRLPNGEGGLIDNGDEIGVPTLWEWPNAFEGVTAADLAEAQKRIGVKPIWRANIQSANWVGHGISDIFGVDSMEKGGRARLNAILKVWLANGALKIIEAPGEDRHPVTWVISSDAGP